MIITEMLGRRKFSGLVEVLSMGRALSFALPIACLLMSSPGLAIDQLVANPQPFRGDELDGRQFRYGGYGFLQRISYVPSDHWLRDWRSGFIGTIGSVTSKEFFSLLNLQKRMLLSEHFEFEIRAERGEDFDTRFERTQIGLGYRFNSSWSLTAFSDLRAAKETEDFQLELRFNDEDDNLFRAAVVATDIPFNDKHETQQYLKQPYTVFVESRWQLFENTSFHGFVNYNAPLSLQLTEQNSIFDYRNVTAQSIIYHQINSTMNLTARIGGERGRRKLESQNSVGKFKRSYATFAVELNVKPENSYAFWLGLRTIKFSESDSQYHLATDSSELRRNEKILYGGMHFKLKSNIVFSPVLFVDAIDNTQYHLVERQKNRRRNRVLVKLNLPFEFHLAHDAIVTLNTTFELDEEDFGGLNLQMYIPF